jgi:uncharacterized membrane protein YfcA
LRPAFTVEAAVLLCLLGFAVGVFGTLVGAGGGFILTPVLLLVYPQSTPALITAISLVVVFFNAGSGSIAYARQKRIDFRSGSVFAVCTLPGSILGVLLADKVSRPGFDVIMGVSLIALAWWLVTVLVLPDAHRDRDLALRARLDGAGGDAHHVAVGCREGPPVTRASGVRRRGRAGAGPATPWREAAARPPSCGS